MPKQRKGQQLLLAAAAPAWKTGRPVDATTMLDTCNVHKSAQQQGTAQHSNRAHMNQILY
jgi:hypothetical protein